jgi:hypothetical protein
MTLDDIRETVYETLRHLHSWQAVRDRLDPLGHRPEREWRELIDQFATERARNAAQALAELVSLEEGSVGELRGTLIEAFAEKNHALVKENRELKRALGERTTDHAI